jgi:hypothetical protein
MKLTIIVEDKAVYVDGVMRVIDVRDCGINGGVHALQWEDNAGWIEYAVTKDGSKPENKPIIQLPKWSNNCVAEWNKLALPKEINPVV